MKFLTNLQTYIGTMEAWMTACSGWPSCAGPPSAATQPALPPSPSLFQSKSTCFIKPKIIVKSSERTVCHFTQLDYKLNWDIMDHSERIMIPGIESQDKLFYTILLNCVQTLNIMRKIISKVLQTGCFIPLSRTYS